VVRLTMGGVVSWFSSMMRDSQYRGRMSVLLTFLPFAAATVYFHVPWILTTLLAVCCMCTD
jgi:hypothetical protein